MAVQKSECFILRKTPLRETSWIVTCLTSAFGKMRGVVKGARKEKSNWASSCELFTKANVVFFEKTRSHLHLITDLSILESHERLRSNFSSLTYAFYFSELLDELLEENHPQPKVFELLSEAVDMLEGKAGSYEMIARVFEIRLLRLLGILPRFSGCLECGNSLEGRIYFSSSEGGILCEICRSGRRAGFAISRGCVRVIDFMMKSDPRIAIRVKLGIQIRKELAEVSRQFIEYRLDRELKSLRFISQVGFVLDRKRSL